MMLDRASIYTDRQSLEELFAENPLWKAMYEELYLEVQRRDEGKMLRLGALELFNEVGYQCECIRRFGMKPNAGYADKYTDPRVANYNGQLIFLFIYVVCMSIPKGSPVRKFNGWIRAVCMRRKYYDLFADFVNSNDGKFRVDFRESRYLLDLEAEIERLKHENASLQQSTQSKSKGPTTLSKNQILFRSHEEQAEWAEVFRRFLTERKQINQSLSKSADSYINRAMACFYHHWAKRDVLREGHPKIAVSYFLFVSCGIQGIDSKTHGNVVDKLLTQCYDMEHGGEMDLAIEMLVEENS